MSVLNHSLEHTKITDTYKKYFFCATESGLDLGSEIKGSMTHWPQFFGGQTQFFKSQDISAGGQSCVGQKQNTIVLQKLLK